jgi:hypothetical protein
MTEASEEKLRITKVSGERIVARVKTSKKDEKIWR